MEKVFLFISLWFSMLTANAENIKTVKLNFNEQQFSFVTNEVGSTTVSSLDLIAGYASDTSLPGLPLVSINVGVPNGSCYAGVSESVTKKMLYSNIVIASNPIAYPTNYVGDFPEKVLPVYSQAMYPYNKVQYVGTSTIDGYTILRFLVCPFEYDIQGKKLYITDNITMNIKLCDSPKLVSSEPVDYGHNMRDVFFDQIVNSEDFEGTENSVQTCGLDLGFPLISNNQIVGKYLIVTTKSLAPYFKPLALWKTQKGFKSEIVTVEEITAQHQGMDIPLAIKTYLRDQYEKNNLRYVLLGGEDRNVPVRKCYCKVTYTKRDNYVEMYDTVTTVEPEMPTDLYYACFDNSFTWDANNNGIYGEEDDDVNFNPSIVVTRAPVYNSTDAQSFVNKILEYEKNPLKNEWCNSILMAGNKMSYKTNIPPCHSDAKCKGDSLYKTAIAPYWNGERKNFYDTWTDFVGGANYDLTPDKLQEQMEKGYAFFDMISHGTRNGFSCEGGTSYTTDYASTLQNPRYTIITTIACNTNGFDTFEKALSSPEKACLSEAFIRNPQSGVVAYFGCSRYGWDYPEPTKIGPSFDFEKEFYKKLFSDKNQKLYKFGDVVTAAKQAYVTFPDEVHKWLQYGLNPIGDPEMPIFTTTPKIFENVSIGYSSDGRNLVIDAGVDSCAICIMSIDDNGKSFYRTYKSAKKVTEPITMPLSICITKKNYIPFFTTRICFSPSQISECIVNSDANTATVSTQLPDNVASADVVIATAAGNGRVVYHVTKDESTICADLSKLPKGIKTVSLVVDGNLVDSRSIINK